MKNFIMLFVVALVLSLAVTVDAADVKVTWTASTAADVVNYVVGMGSTSRGTNACPEEFAYDSEVNVGLALEYTIADYTAAGTMYVSVCAEDGFGNKSCYSNEGILDIRPDSPSSLTIEILP